MKSIFGTGRANIGAILGASFGSNLVDGIRVTAFAVLAATFSSSPVEIALVATVAALPDVLLGIPLGVLLDRWNKRLALMYANLLRIFLLLLLSVAIAFDLGSIPLLCTFAFIYGVCEEVYDSASIVVIPDLAEPNEYIRTNSLVRWMQELGNGAIGPVFGAALASWIAPSPFVVGALLLFLVSFFLRKIRIPGSTFKEADAPSILKDNSDNASRDSTERANVKSAFNNFWTELKDGLKYTAKNPFARNVVSVLGLWSFFGWMPEGILILYVKQDLASNDEIYGVLLAVTSLGALIGGTLIFLLPRKAPIRSITSISLAIYGLTLAIPGFIPNIYIAAAMFFIQGLPLIILNGSVTAEMQTRTDSRYLGRVYSVVGAVSSLTTAGGLFLGGVLATATTNAFVFAFSGVCLIFVALFAFWKFSSKMEVVAGD